jgi:hypothetical protein
MRPRQGGAEVRTAEWRAGGLLVSAPTTVVWAQRNSFLLATVTDASNHAPLQNVVGTATSPAVPGEQRAVTDDAGGYRIPQLH